jgi:hypothetical protein
LRVASALADVSILGIEDVMVGREAKVPAGGRDVGDACGKACGEVWSSAAGASRASFSPWPPRKLVDPADASSLGVESSEVGRVV